MDLLIEVHKGGWQCCAALTHSIFQLHRGGG
jgi:hypothetical protein